MPLIVKENAEVPIELVTHLKTSNYSFKSLVLHGLVLDKTNLEIRNLKKYESTIKEINVIFCYIIL